MSKISCKLFGVPQIMKDGQSVFLPYAKINALLYYMLINKVVSRTEIAGLLWPDENEETAKKNLRNAVYQTKRSLGLDIIVSPKKSVLILNQDLEIEIDVDVFSSAPREHMDLYTGDFLQGFFLKGSEAYEYWIVKTRNYLKEKFSSECYLKIEEDIQNQNYVNVEDRIQRLIELDEYDERNFRLLMRFYQDTGRNGKVIETYYELSKLLRRELGVEPDQKTKEIYERSLRQMNFGEGKERTLDDSFFYGRLEEIAALEKTLLDFKQKKDGRSLVIRGEPGSGKSTLKRRFLEEAADNFIVLEVRCCQVEQGLFLRPWRRAAEEIETLTRRERQILPEAWKDLMVQVFPDFMDNLPNETTGKLPLSAVVHIMGESVRALAAQRQVILVFEDLQWMDADSLRLLTAVLLETDPTQVMLLGTCTKEYSRALEDTLTELSRYNRLQMIELERFTIEACHHLIEKALPGKAVEGETLERIYGETEGNPLLLSEYIAGMKRGDSMNTITQAMTESVKGRFLYLSQEELDFARDISLFYDEIPLRMVQQLTGKTGEELLQLLGNLENRDILSEQETDKGPAILFTHGKLREYCYMTLPASRKKALHQKVGVLLEEEINSSGKKDNKLYAKLIYHFSASGDYLKVLKYRIANLNDHLNFSHLMFPILDNLEMDSDVKVYISRDKIEALFSNLEASFREVRDMAQGSMELALLELEFFYMKGRYYIMEGRYEDGINDIMYVIDKSRQIENYDYTLEGYKQLIFYYLQINDTKRMGEYVELALELAVARNYHREIGVFLRLRGLYYMMGGSYRLAESYLMESIQSLSVTKEMARQYAANIAAAYNYIGEIRQAQEKYTDALNLFGKAISLCPGNALSSLSVFYINAGKTAYFQQNLSAAQMYFDKAYGLYGQFDSFWKRSILDSYMALTLIGQHQYQKALEYLVSARQNMGYIKNPSDFGTVYFAEALICKMGEKDQEIWEIFGETLRDSPDHYYRRAMKNLNQHLDKYEINLLNQLFKQG